MLRRFWFIWAGSSAGNQSLSIGLRMMREVARNQGCDNAMLVNDWTDALTYALAWKHAQVSVFCFGLGLCRRFIIPLQGETEKNFFLIFFFKFSGVFGGFSDFFFSG